MSASLREAIEAAGGRVAAAYTAAEAKGATMPTTQNLANLADAIASISGGGSGEFQKVTMQMTFPTKVLSAQLSYDLPSAPKIISIHKAYTPQEANEIVLAVCFNLPWTGSFNVNGVVRELGFYNTFFENRISDAYLNSFAQVYIGLEPTNTYFRYQVRNAAYGFIGTYDVDLYY